MQDILGVLSLCQSVLLVGHCTYEHFYIGISMRVRGVDISSVEVQDVYEQFAHGQSYRVLVIVHATCRGLLVHMTYTSRTRMS